MDPNTMYEYSDISRLSLWLGKCMENIGASEEIRKFQETFSDTKGIADTITSMLELTKSSVYVHGSCSEGTTTLGLNSDVDVLYCNNDIEVHDDVNRATDFGPSLFMDRDINTKPGYVKLVCVESGLFQYANDIGYRNVDSRGRLCLTHVTEEDVLPARNGPANVARHDAILPIKTGLVYKCPRVPRFVCENQWFKDDGSYRRSRVKGCFVIGVGHPTSEERQLEWRLCFTAQERELMSRLNPTQLKCLILLKMIKKDFIKPIFGEFITTYHCKTSLFYVIANTSQDIWKPDQLLQCTMLCLFVLFKWVEHRNCPNYFIKDENMFDILNVRRMSVPLMQVLNRLLLNGQRLPFLIKCDNIGEMMQSVFIQRHLSPTMNNSRVKYAYALALYLKKTTIEFGRRLDAITQSKDDWNSICYLYTVLEGLSSGYNIIGYSTEQTVEALSYLTPVLHAQLAKKIASFVFKNPTISDRGLMDASLYCFGKGINSDWISTSLMYLSVLYKLQQYESCLQVLEQIDTKMSSDVITVCVCENRKHEISSHVSQQLRSKGVSFTNIMVSCATSCVIFKRSDVAITPSPLEYEMFRSLQTHPSQHVDIADDRYDDAVVDAKVFLYFMHYLVCSKLNKSALKTIAIQKLAWVIKSDQNLGHLETAYNLLGWIYMKENRAYEGLHYFRESLKIKPVNNAAKWHLQEVELQKTCTADVIN